MYAQTPRFESAGLGDLGLTGTVTCILEDKQGFLWFGSTDGLFRYDGVELRAFRYDAQDSTSLSNNAIHALVQDEEDRIWVATDQGLNAYIPQEERFRRYFNTDNEPFMSVNYILDVHVDRKGKVWYGTYQGLFRIDPDGSNRLIFSPQPEQEASFPDKLAWKIFEDSKGRLWFGTNQGVALYENDDEFKFKVYPPEFKAEQSLKATRVWEFAEQADGSIWLGTNAGIFRVLETEGDLQFQQFKHDPANPNSLSHDFIQSIHVDGPDRLWVGTWDGGLNEMILEGDSSGGYQFIHHRANSAVDYSISMDRIMEVYRDRSGVFWVATGKSLQKASTSSAKFLSIRHSASQPYSLTDNIIKAILRDSKGNLWVGTRDGLNFLSAADFARKRFHWTHFKHDPTNANSLSHHNIFALSEDSQGLLWISTYQGLNYLDLNDVSENSRFQHFNTQDGLPHNFIYQTQEDQPGVYWVSTYGKLARMFFDRASPENTQFQWYDMDPKRDNALVNATCYMVEKDRFGQTWIATFGGLSKFIVEGENEYFENYQNDFEDLNSLSSNLVSSMLLDSKGRLWVATRTGLNLMQQTTAKEPVSFRVFGTKDGFRNDVIQSIEEDLNGLLWIGTNKGLVCFDPEAALKGEPPVRNIYDNQDGLPGSSLIFRASHRDTDGRLYFGTPNGFTSFIPGHIQENEYTPPLVFTELKIDNESVKASIEKAAILQQSINYTDAISLQHWQNVVDVQFAALDYNRPTKNEYAYRLMGFDLKWNHIGQRNTVTFTNLSPGRYTLQIKAANSDGYWNEEPKELHIRVLPPPWKTWWAYSIYALLGIGFLYIFIQFRLKQQLRRVEEQARLERARYEERDRLRKVNAQDFHDELGHRLTKMSLFLELAQREKNASSQLQQYLVKIKNHSAALSEGVRDLIWSLDPEKDTLHQTLLRLQEFGDKLFDYSDITFRSEGIQGPLDAYLLPANLRKQILLIFKEAMHNCLKYAKCKNASLAFGQQDSRYFIQFQDDGVGFEMDQISKGYGLTNMQKRAEKIDAILHLDSQIEEGTRIRLVFDLKAVYG